jgi:N-acetylglucosaminyldiphosphoundecaprenol N-acetyl-beta-D-mannosaminyltransferase
LFTSANGQVLSMCRNDIGVREPFLAADLIHADGMPLMFASRLLSAAPLLERVATTDLIYEVAKVAEARGAARPIQATEYQVAGC